MYDQAPRNCILSSPTRVTRKKAVPKPVREWEPVFERKKHVEEPEAPAVSPIRRKIIKAPEPETELVCFFKLSKELLRRAVSIQFSTRITY